MEAALQNETNGTILMPYAGINIGLIIIAVVDFFGARAWITPIKVQLTTMAV